MTDFELDELECSCFLDGWLGWEDWLTWETGLGLGFSV